MTIRSAGRRARSASRIVDDGGLVRLDRDALHDVVDPDEDRHELGLEIGEGRQLIAREVGRRVAVDAEVGDQLQGRRRRAQGRHQLVGEALRWLDRRPDRERVAERDVPQTVRTRCRGRRPAHRTTRQRRRRRPWPRSPAHCRTMDIGPRDLPGNVKESAPMAHLGSMPTGSPCGRMRNRCRPGRSGRFGSGLSPGRARQGRGGPG